jgi:hypothetical protein
MTPTGTSPDANIELLRASFEDFDAGDLDACVARPVPGFVIS